MEDRAGENRLKLFVLMEANRFVVTGGLAVVVFATFVFAVVTLEPSFVEQLASGDMVDTMFTSMIGAVLTGTTLVVSIGQLILTQETGPLGDQRERMENAMEYRGFIEEMTAQPTPNTPNEFLRALVDETIARSTALRDELDGGGDSDLQDEIDRFVTGVLENAQEVSDQLTDAQFGSFDVLSAALNYNYSWKMARIEQFQSEYDEILTDRDHELLEELQTSLSMFGPAREHIKTLYFQWELISLSQMILYAAIPAVVVAGVMIAVVTPATAPGTLFGIERAVLLVGAAFTVTLLPFLLFVSYILRILTVAKRTLAIEPLILRD